MLAAWVYPPSVRSNHLVHGDCEYRKAVSLKAVAVIDSGFIVSGAVYDGQSFGGLPWKTDLTDALELKTRFDGSGCRLKRLPVLLQLCVYYKTVRLILVWPGFGPVNF